MKAHYKVVGLLVFLASATPLAAAPQVAAGTAPAAGVVPVAFPTFGLAVKPPAGFVRLRPLESSHVAAWAKLDAAKKQPVAMLEIWLQRHRDMTLDAFAQDMAKKLAGEVEATPVTVDGSEGRLIVGKRRPGAVAPARAVVVKREDLFYLFGSSQLSDQDISAEFQLFWTGCKWVTPEPPAKHIAALDQRRPLFAGKAVVDLPSVIRPYPKDDTAVLLFGAATNFIGVHDEFQVHIELAPLPETVDFEALKLKQLEGISKDKRMTLKSKAEWQPNVAPDRAMTNLVEVEQPDSAALKGTRYVQWSLIKSGKDWVIASFHYNNVSAEDRDAYEKAARKIVESIQFKPAAAPAAR